MSPPELLVIRFTAGKPVMAELMVWILPLVPFRLAIRPPLVKFRVLPAMVYCEVPRLPAAKVMLETPIGTPSVTVPAVPPKMAVSAPIQRVL